MTRRHSITDILTPHRMRAFTMSVVVSLAAGGCASASTPSAATGGNAAVVGAAVAAAAAPKSAGDLGITDTRVGTGARAMSRQCLYVHYVGLLADGRKFDSTRDPNPTGQIPEPVAFELGTNAVMPGWEKGLVGMQVGGLRRLWVPYRLAYGAGGQPPTIPPRTDLVFDIELMAVVAPLPNASNAMRAESAKTCPAWSSVGRGR